MKNLRLWLMMFGLLTSQFLTAAGYENMTPEQAKQELHLLLRDHKTLGAVLLVKGLVHPSVLRTAVLFRILMVPVLEEAQEICDLPKARQRIKRDCKGRRDLKTREIDRLLSAMDSFEAWFNIHVPTCKESYQELQKRGENATPEDYKLVAKVLPVFKDLISYKIQLNYAKASLHSKRKSYQRPQ